MTRGRGRAGFLIALSATLAGADDSGEDAAPPLLDAVHIVGERQARARVAGSAHRVGEEALDTFEHDDVHRILEQTPGVYTRTEDGYGLRPNIGLRGASSDRSAKVTLMEDGVLFAPAPYSAPAAYYFPLLARVTAVEVFKGPASIRHGPNTIGGAVNMVSRRIPHATSAAADVALGQHGFYKTHIWAGAGQGRWGALLEGAALGSDGFKHLDGGGATGFNKYEGVLKLRWESDPEAEIFHRLVARLGRAVEGSDETYLGLTDDDFEATPYRRYAASQWGHMEWLRHEARLSWDLEIGDDLALRTDAYRQEFDRAWRKFDGFGGAGAPDVRRILAFPDGGSRALYADLLRGSVDSDRTDDTQRLLIGTNDRAFVSQGVQVVGAWRIEGTIRHDVEVGLRLHQDSIVRDHSRAGAWMTEGSLEADGAPSEDTAQNTASTWAVAAHVADEIGLGARLFVTPGLRVERIDARFDDDLQGLERRHRYTVLIPGLGAYLQLAPRWGLLAGVHRGFSPVSPASAEGLDPERSVSYETGIRYGNAQGAWHGELIGFLNDYDNLTASCTQSAVGCPADQLGVQFAGGEVDVYGLEASAKGATSLPAGIRLTASAAYTLTYAEFQTGFRSAFGQWGQVTQGDELPYVPRHRGSFTAGLGTMNWALDATLTHVGVMRDEAGSGPIDGPTGVPAHSIVDVAMAWFVGDSGALYVKLDNALGADVMASRRPYGARPGKPMTLGLGFKQDWGRP